MKSCLEILSTSIKFATKSLVCPIHYLVVLARFVSLTSGTIVASKCGFDVFGPERKVTNSAAHIHEYIDGTIKRLGFAPDLYYLHRIDPGGPPNSPLLPILPNATA